MRWPACATASCGDERVHDIANYIRKGKLWEAFTAPELPVLLIDEIDKADIEFPNDLLQELDRMEFDVYETHETIARQSSARSSLSPRTTRRNCPTRSCAAASSTTSNSPIGQTMQSIIDVHFPDIQKTLVAEAMDIFLRSARSARPQEEAQHERTARLAQAPARRGHAARRRCRTATRPRRSRPCTARCSRTSRT